MQSKLSLVGTCQKCMKDGVQDPTRKCVGIYDCCSSYPTWRNMFYTEYSDCAPAKTGPDYCKACTKVNATCDEWTNCCKDYSCDAKKLTCSVPPNVEEYNPDPPEDKKPWCEGENEDIEKGQKLYFRDENENENEEFAGEEQQDDEYL